MPTKENYRKYRKRCIRESIRYSQKLKVKIFDILGKKCKECGFKDIRALQIDHIDGGGSKERAVLNGRTRNRMILLNLLNGSKNYQILCANCNWIKRYKNKEYKHTIG